MGKGQAEPQEAKYILVDYDRIDPLCRSCLDERLYMEGEINLDYYHLGLDSTVLVRRINEILNYHRGMIERYSTRYFAAKSIGEDCQKRNVKIAPETLLRVLEWN